MKCSILRQNALMIHSTILVFLHVPLFNCQYLMQLHTILDEMISGGQVIETSSEQIMKSVEEIERLEKQSSTTSFIPKSITERFTR
ncbi:AP-3 complex subunit sigma [Zea mays]|uniref:AP-3 complex subunit sigma n=1 Tax=Zea mays TaxID=4577 RepID=A0A1D6PFK3_MAIZE|nr:AP-3 complex subunit sigma [Zea mays]